MRKDESSRENPSDHARGQFAYERLDRAMHERARLGIMTSLMAHPDGLLFAQLKAMCDLTDGNLNRHLDVLAADGLVNISKEPVGGRMQTICRLTPRGRKRFLDYLEELQKVLSDATRAADNAASSKQLATQARALKNN